MGKPHIYEEAGIRYLVIDGVNFALPVVEAVPLSKEDRKRFELESAVEYYRAHRDKREPAAFAYFGTRYEQEVIALKTKMRRVAGVLRTMADALEESSRDI